jgi:hypothetical protein
MDGENALENLLITSEEKMNEQNIHFLRERANDGIHDGEIVINEYKPHEHMTVGEMALAVALPFILLFFYAIVGALEG